MAARLGRDFAWVLNATGDEVAYWCAVFEVTEQESRRSPVRAPASGAPPVMQDGWAALDALVEKHRAGQ